MRHKKWMRFLPCGLWMLAIFIGSSVPGQSVPKMWAFRFDKVLHTMEYVVLGGLAYYGLAGLPWAGMRSRRRVVLCTLLIAFVYGISDEIHQMFVPGRMPDWRDVVADTIGGTIGGVLGAGWMCRRQRREEGAQPATAPERTAGAMDMEKRSQA